MYLLCSDWSIRSLEKEEENCHLFITARRTDEGRDKNNELFFSSFFCTIMLFVQCRTSFIRHVEIIPFPILIWHACLNFLFMLLVTFKDISHKRCLVLYL